MAQTFEETVDEIFDGKCQAVRDHMEMWRPGQSLGRCTVVALCYIAWKLAEIERRLAGRP